MTRSAALDWSDTDARTVDLIRVLAMDAVERAGSGHPGTAMSLAPAAYLLYQKVMRHDPSDPLWPGRDRFVLSCGHSSLTLYIQLYLSGYGLTLDDLEHYRVWGSKTPGHPEHHLTAGVETTTGPLGQGIGNAVGMAMAARRERGLLDREAAPGSSPFDHYIYCFVSDGDMEEGISHEAASLAGHQQLGNLIVLYDDNNISIEDDTNIAKSEDIAARYEAYGWHVQRLSWRAGRRLPRGRAGALRRPRDGAGRPRRHRPSSHCARSSPGPRRTRRTPAPRTARRSAPQEVAATKKVLGFDPDVSFPREDELVAHARKVADRGKQAHAAWDEQFAAWSRTHPQQRELFDRLSRAPAAAGLDRRAAGLPRRREGGSHQEGLGRSTERAGARAAGAVGRVRRPGGQQRHDDEGRAVVRARDPPDQDVPRQQVRPDAALRHPRARHGRDPQRHRAARPDPARTAAHSWSSATTCGRSVRLAALMGLPVTYVWTHDSIGLGEDGPTHQPVEHLWALRAIPGLDVVRPADANEITVAWRTILERTDHPAGLCLSRQNLPVFDRSASAGLASAEGTARGGYVLADAGGRPARRHPHRHRQRGAACARGRKLLADDGIRARVVSMPCVEWFLEQDAAYRDQVLPPHIQARVSVEAGIALGWRQFIGDAGRSVSLEHFGASADYKKLYAEFGITADSVAEAARDSLANVRPGEIHR